MATSFEEFGIVRSDPKRNHATNVLEKLIGKDERFQSYLSQLGQTRNHVQQTELGHFTPASQKPKARFMNLGPSQAVDLIPTRSVSFEVAIPRNTSLSNDRLQHFQPTTHHHGVGPLNLGTGESRSCSESER